MSVQFRRTFNSPINNSSSKQLFSFSKADRFEATRRSECKQSFYETKRGSLEKRAASFGYGYKMSFANTQNVPAVGTYNKLNDFQINKNKKRGNSFGFDENRSLISNPKQIKRFPGPGAYLSIDQQHKTGYGSSFERISFSIRGKYEDPLERHKNQLGPGQYSTYGQTDKKGKYYNTKYVDSMCRKFSKDTRFHPQKIESPGPGHYKAEHKINLNGTGTYFNSKYVTKKGSSFGLEQRPSPAKKNEAPDPGTYYRFSDFALLNKSTIVDRK